MISCGISLLQWRYKCVLVIIIDRWFSNWGPEPSGFIEGVTPVLLVWIRASFNVSNSSYGSQAVKMER